MVRTNSKSFRNTCRRVLGAALLCIPFAVGSGCTGTGRATFVLDAPPPPRRVVIVDRPGYIWVDGYWDWQGRWVWRDGYYTARRPNYVYVQGTWVHSSRGYVYRPGRWEARGKVVIRGKAKGRIEAPRHGHRK